MILKTIKLVRKEQCFEAALCIVRESFGRLTESCHKFLHDDERIRLRAFEYEKKQRDYLLGRYASKRAIQKLYPYYPPVEFNIYPGVFGHPVVVAPDQVRLQLSISHTEFVGAALAFPEAHPMGIDVEYARSNTASAIVEQLSANEMMLVNSLGLDRRFAFTMFWTIKEALGKVTKCGMTLPFGMMAVKSVRQSDDGVVVGEFSHFIQYKSLSYVIDDFVCTLVLPRKTSIRLNLSSLSLEASKAPWEFESGKLDGGLHVI